MVRERQPLMPTQALRPAQTTSQLSSNGDDNSQTDALPKQRMNTSAVRPPHRINDKATIDLTGSSPIFGAASPLRNPLKKTHNHIFNVSRSGPRVEHHPSSSRASSAEWQPMPATINPKPPASYGTYDSFHNSRPIFSSTQPPNGFQPINPSKKHSTEIDLVRNDDDEDEDDFDPNAALRSLSFGERDPYMYVDSERASKDIKALIEGAFDEEAPRFKLRKRAKVETSAANAGGKGLASKLASLELQTDKREDEKHDDDDPEDGTIEGLKVKLLPHQVEGLAWMTDKEIGERKKGSPLPMGGILADDMGLGKTLQSMAVILTNPRPSDTEIEEANRKIRLKKQKMSLKMSKSTLVVAPLALIRQWEAELQSKVSASHQLKVLVHHGSSRTKLGSELKKYDVVITTYQIIASEHSGSSTSPDGPKLGCFGVHWYRIILDEAHTIKNRNAKSTKACYALQSHFRWCLTGTPMQNNLEELQSLIAFLRIRPYCDLASWKEQISAPMKNGRGGLAMKRLQFFLKACMKRRTKEILKKEGALVPGGKPTAANDEGSKTEFRMVERKVESVVAEFNARERSFYDSLAARAQNSLEDMILKDKVNNIGALVLLLRLRQACNHPRLITANAKKDKDALEAGTDLRDSKASTDAADDLADLLGGLTVEAKKCDSCGSKLQSHEVGRTFLRCDACEHDKELFEEADDRSKGRREHIRKKRANGAAQHKQDIATTKLSRRGRQIITDSDDEEEAEWLVSSAHRGPTSLGVAGGSDDENAEGGGETLGSLDSGSENEESAEESRSEDETDSESEDDVRTNHDSKSKYRKTYIDNPFACTKIRHLLRILDKETPNHKVIVFSQFTTMLDLTEPFLRDAGFVFTRYDGSMKNDDRELSLQRLRTDPKTRVLLCSLKCGSLGLNLTAASRVVILEPFWNPFVEEQAIDRVHRLNQTVDVHVYKITIADSVEERILELQESKRKLAAAAIEQGGANGLNKLSMQDIMNLFKRDAELNHKSTAEDHFLRQHGRILASPVRAAELPATERWRGGSNHYDTKKVVRRVDDPVYGRR